MQIKFETSGIHIKSGLLKVRADFRLNDPASKTYARQYIQVATEPMPPECFDNKKDPELVKPVYDAWWSQVPKLWRLNPALCFFLSVPENINLVDLTEYLKEKVFTPDNIATIDSFETGNTKDFAHRISAFVRQIPRLTDTKVQTKDLADLITTTKLLLAGKEIDLSGGGKVIDVEPRSIDMGPDPTNRGSIASANTRVELTNPANATGTINTIQVWANSDLAGFDAGTMYLDAGTVYKCRDKEDIGAVTAGSVQTFGSLSIDAIIGDYMGHYFTSGQVERDTSGFGGYRYPAVSSELIAGNSYDMVTLAADDACSVYGTGTESGVTEKTASDTGAGVDAVLNALGIIAKSDSGAGVDAIYTRAVSLLESALGVDAVTNALAILSGADTGSGIEAVFSRAIMLTESGFGSDLLSSLLAVLLSSDSGAGADAIQQLANLLTASDSGVGADALLALLAAIIDDDSGTGVETIGSRILALSDSGSSAETSILIGAIIAIVLTLAARSRTFNLRTRSLSLTLPVRSLNLTLPERN